MKQYISYFIIIILVSNQIVYATTGTLSTIRTCITAVVTTHDQEHTAAELVEETNQLSECTIAYAYNVRCIALPILYHKYKHKYIIHNTAPPTTPPPLC